jgi:hypothetical protein
MTRTHAAILWVLLIRWDYLDDHYTGCLLDGEDGREIVAEMCEIEDILSGFGIDSPAEMLADMKARGMA